MLNIKLSYSVAENLNKEIEKVIGDALMDGCDVIVDNIVGIMEYEPKESMRRNKKPTDTHIRSGDYVSSISIVDGSGGRSVRSGYYGLKKKRITSWGELTLGYVRSFKNSVSRSVVIGVPYASDFEYFDSSKFRVVGRAYEQSKGNVKNVIKNSASFNLDRMK